MPRTAVPVSYTMETNRNRPLKRRVKPWLKTPHGVHSGSDSWSEDETDGGSSSGDTAAYGTRPAAEVVQPQLRTHEVAVGR